MPRPLNRGSENGRHFLLESQVKIIRRMYKEGTHSQRELGEMFCVSRQTINEIVNRKTWRHVK